MKARLLRNIILLILLIPLSNCTKDEDSRKIKTLRIYGASGVRDVATEVSNLFEKTYGIRIEKNFASSGTLARQIASGAECDLYISANKDWIDYLANQGILKEETITEVGTNRLVEIIPENLDLKPLRYEKNFKVLSAVKDKIAVGNPAYVPVGKYTKGVMKKLGWFKQLKGSMVMAKNVSAALHYVETGECDRGFVYYTVALQSKKVKINSIVPEKLHKPIIFYMASLRGQSPDTDKLWKFYKGKKGESTFKKYGFLSTEKNIVRR